MAKSYYNIIEVLVNVYAADKDGIKVLVKRKRQEAYKGYYLLPAKVLSNKQTLNECVFQIMGKKELPFIQGIIKSDLDRCPEKRVIACTFIVLVDKDLVSNKDMVWFNVDNLPKMAYDYKEITEANALILKKKILCNEDNVLFDLFPSEFTLSELQSFFEKILDKPLDCRNFRKKLINDKLVVATDDLVTTGGRPSKLYRFNKKG